jgi:preprotein translocase subunit SecE
VNKLTTYLKDIYIELTEKTSWPSFADLKKDSITVLIASVIFSLMIYVMDAGFTKLMDIIYNL